MEQALRDPVLDPRSLLELRYGTAMHRGATHAAERAWSASDEGAAYAAAAVPKPPMAVRALNRMAFGPTSEDIALFNSLGGTDAERLANYVEWQCAWSDIDDSALDDRLAQAGYETLNKPLTQLWAQHVRPDPVWDVRMRPAWETQRAAFVRAVFSKRQLREVLANFWHDHFSVFGIDYITGPVLVHYDRDVIRRYAFGNFRSMLEAVAKSTAMLYYLDNVSNSRSGPNENWARELLELHTLGADNYYGFMNPFDVPPAPEDPDYPAGYTDIDVYETAAAFTGWSIKNGHWQFPNENDGTFVYRSTWHDQGPKFVLGMLLNPEQPALKDGQDILDRLASHPKVAKFICTKLVRRLVGDSPPAGLVDSAAGIFRSSWQQVDQIKRTVRHILLSPEFAAAWGQKTRRPFEAVAAAMRAVNPTMTLRMGHDKSNDFMWRFGSTGNAPFQWPAPNGYPDRGSAWQSSNTLVMTWKMLSWLTETSDDGNPVLPIVQISREQVPRWTANALVNYWSQRILGYSLPSGRRQTLVRFMAQNGDASSYVITDTDSWAENDLKSHYNHQRLKSMVALILMTPEFLRR